MALNRYRKIKNLSNGIDDDILDELGELDTVEEEKLLQEKKNRQHIAKKTYINSRGVIIYGLITIINKWLKDEFEFNRIEYHVYYTDKKHFLQNVFREVNWVLSTLDIYKLDDIYTHLGYTWDSNRADKCNQTIYENPKVVSNKWFDKFISFQEDIDEYACV